MNAGDHFRVSALCAHGLPGYVDCPECGRYPFYVDPASRLDDAILPEIHVTLTPPPPSLFKVVCRWDRYANCWMIVGSCYTPYRQKAYVSGVAPAQT